MSIGYWAIVPSLADTAIGDDVASPKLFPVALVEGGQAGESIEVRLAFNHGQMLADAIERARDRLEDTTIVASFCGPEFTISELRGVYDAVWRTKLDPGNFQRKVKQTNDFLVSQQRTNHSDDKAGRPPSGASAPLRGSTLPYQGPTQLEGDPPGRRAALPGHQLPGR